MNEQSKTPAARSAFKWRSLHTKIIAWSFVPTVIILATVAWFTFYSYQQVTRDLVLKQDQELTQSKANQSAQALFDRQKRIESGRQMCYTAFSDNLSRNQGLSQIRCVSTRPPGIPSHGRHL